MKAADISIKIKETIVKRIARFLVGQVTLRNSSVLSRMYLIGKENIVFKVIKLINFII